MRLITYADRDEWLAARRLGLGGTDVARILGIAPRSWGGPVRVWEEKRGTVADALDENEAMRWGRILEGPVAQEWARRERKTIGSVEGVIVHPAMEWARGTADRLVLHRGEPQGVLEVKTAGVWNRDEWGADGCEATDETVPDHYIIQLQWYLAITGLSRGWFVVLIGGQEMRSLPAERDDDLIALLLDKCGAWWQTHVVDGARPPADGSPDMDAYLRSLYPRAVPEVKHLDMDYAVRARALLDTKAQIAALETRAETLTQEIKLAMGDAERAQAGAFRMRWANCKGRRSFDTKALTADHPDIAQQYTRTGDPYRRFTMEETGS